MSNNPKVSIITVVYNGVEFLEETIKSVVNQTYDNIEYILIDGGSTDGTVDIIKKYEDKIDYWVSEPDKGLYDAMNKGTNVASGDWLNFMNSGDIFTNNKVLRDINFGLYGYYVVIYGDAVLDGKMLQYPLDIINKGLKTGMMMACHQAMFFNKKILKGKLKYNTLYKISGDYELIIKLYLEHQNLFKYVGINIASCQASGISSGFKAFFKIAMEHKKIQINYFDCYEKKGYAAYLLLYTLSFLPKTMHDALRSLLISLKRFIFSAKP